MYVLIATPACCILKYLGTLHHSGNEHSTYVAGHHYLFFSFQAKLSINIAKRASKRTHRIRHGDVLKRVLQHGSKRQCILQRAIAAGRLIQKRDCAGDLGAARSDILVLPDPPCAVDHGVVEVEGLGACQWKRMRYTETLQLERGERERERDIRGQKGR